MKADRRHYRKCNKKIKHQSKAKAIGHIYCMMESGKMKGHTLSPYRCRICDQWHVGRSINILNNLLKSMRFESETMMKAEL